MIPLRNELPDDVADWGSVTINFPKLAPDSVETCPTPLAHVLDYLRTESGDTESESSDCLSFVRTALLGGEKYWLWKFVEEDAAECFVFVRQGNDGRLMTSLVSPNGLSAEQCLLADYFDEVYWS